MIPPAIHTPPNLFISQDNQCSGEMAIVKKPTERSNLSCVNKTNNNTNSYDNMNGKKLDNASKLDENDRAWIPVVFWTLLILLFILAGGNLILTSVIMSVLRLGKGMESMQLLPDEGIVFSGNVELRYVNKKDGLIEGLRDKPIEISSENGSVEFDLITRQSRAENRLTVNTSGVYVLGVSNFLVKDPNSRETVFNALAPKLNMPDGARNLQAKVVTTKKISSPSSENLNLRSDTAAFLRGAEGTFMESKELLWSADQDIYLKSINGSIILSGKEGVYVDVKNIPIATTHIGGFVPVSQFKVCVCMPQGKLFRVAVPEGMKERVSCSHVNVTGEHNPCL